MIFYSRITDPGQIAFSTFVANSMIFLMISQFFLRVRALFAHVTHVIPYILIMSFHMFVETWLIVKSL